MTQLTWMNIITMSNLEVWFAPLSVCFVVYIITLAVHRLYLTPLARFPGPWLAAFTLWYEFYYDVVLRGRYTWKICEMHRKYGMRQI